MSHDTRWSPPEGKSTVEDVFDIVADLLEALEAQGHKSYPPHHTDTKAEMCWHCGEEWPCLSAELRLCRICHTEEWPCAAARAIALAKGEEA
jgi:ribosomal protein S14